MKAHTFESVSADHNNAHIYMRNIIHVEMLHIIQCMQDNGHHFHMYYITYAHRRVLASLHYHQ